MRFPCLMLAAALVVFSLAAAAPIQAKTKATVKSVQIKNGKKRIKLQKGGTIQLKTSVHVSPNKSAYKKVESSYFGFRNNRYTCKKIILDRKWIHVDTDSDEEIIRVKVKKILPSNAKNKSIKWDTDDETVADIDSDGTIVIGEPGKATITAYAADEGGAFADCTIIVSGDDSDDDDDDDYDDYQGDDDDEFEWY